MRYVAVPVVSLITLSRWVRDQLASLYSEEEGLSQGIRRAAGVRRWVYSSYCSRSYVSKFNTQRQLRH